MTDWEALDALIKKVAKNVARDFPSIEAEDLSQDIWVWALDPTTLETVVFDDPKDPTLKRLLYIKAKEFAWNIRRSQLVTSAQYSYRRPDVECLLETYFDQEDWWYGWTPADAATDERDKMAPIEIRLDLALALRQLPWELKVAVVSRYQLKVIPDKQTRQAEDLAKAIDLLVESMNTYYASTDVAGHPGSRRARSNASDRYILENQEEE